MYNMKIQWKKRAKINIQSYMHFEIGSILPTRGSALRTMAWFRHVSLFQPLGLHYGWGKLCGLRYSTVAPSPLTPSSSPQTGLAPEVGQILSSHITVLFLPSSALISGSVPLLQTIFRATLLNSRSKHQWPSQLCYIESIPFMPYSAASSLSIQ